jgi:alpha-1,2-mannosyltransferase
MTNLSYSHRVATALAANPVRLRVAFLGLLALALALASVKYAAKVSKPADTGEQSRSAFLRWRTMIRDVFTGTNIYVGKNEYPNPPIMALILRPFAELPPVVGAMSWFYAKVLMAVLAAVWTFRLVSPQPSEPGAGQVPDGAKAAAVLLALPAVMGDLTHNNVNIFILFLVAGCLELYRSGRDVSSGVVLALAVACKVMPVMLLAFFVWKRAGRVVGGCAAGLVLWLVVAPGCVFGFDRNAELLTDWYRLMVERPVLKGEVTSEHPNQSIVGFVYRLATHSPSFVDYAQTPEGDVPVPAAYHNLVDIGRPAAWAVVKLATLGFAVAIMLLCRTPRAERQGWRFAAECGLIVMAMLLLSERTWKHHAVVLLVPAAALAVSTTVGLPAGVRRFVVASLVAAGLLMTVPGVFGTRAGDLALVYGTHTLAFVLLTAATAAVLVCGLQQRDRSGGARPGEIST